MKTKNKYNILIIDLFSASNRGDAAIIEGEINSLKKFFPDAKYTLLTAFPDASFLINNIKSYNHNLISFDIKNVRINLLVVYLAFLTLIRRLGIKKKIMPRIFNKTSIKLFFEADLIISTGGGFLNDFYFPENLWRFLSLYIMKGFDKKVVIIAQSIGPLKKKITRIISKIVFNRIDLITVRDENSKKILESIGINKTPVHVTADAAFNIPVNKISSLTKFRVEKIPKIESQMNISISIRDWVYYKNKQQYIHEISKTVEWLIEEYDANIYFLSTCTGLDGYKNDDRTFSYKLVSNLEEKMCKNIKIFFGEYTPQELICLYAQMDLHIGMRMHSIILSLLSNTPTIAIEYEKKTKELMYQYGFKDFLFNIENIKFKNIRSKIIEVMKNKEKITERIRIKNKDMKEKSLHNAELIYKMIKEEHYKK